MTFVNCIKNATGKKEKMLYRVDLT